MERPRQPLGSVPPAVMFALPATGMRTAETVSRGYPTMERLPATQRPLHGVSSLLSGLSDILAESTSREEIERRLVALIVSQPGWTAGWIGTVDDAGEHLELRTHRGFDGVGSPTCAVEETPSAVQQAIETDEPHCCSAASSSAGPLDPSAVGGRRLLVVPLSHSHHRYGLCGVVASKPATLSAHQRDIVGSLGTMVATGLHAVETRRLLTTDQVIECSIEIRDPEFGLSAVAAAVDAPVEYAGETQSAGRRELYLTTTGGFDDPETLQSLPFVEAARCVSRSDTESTLSIRTAASTVFDALAVQGGVVVAATATADRAVVTIEAPPECEVRSLLAGIRERYETVDLQRRTTRERGDRCPTPARGLDDQLTDRQRTALAAAYHNGYFEWPRPVDGSDVAETMDITRQTFHQHLRAAERKLIEAYMES